MKVPNSRNIYFSLLENAISWIGQHSPLAPIPQNCTGSIRVLAEFSACLSEMSTHLNYLPNQSCGREIPRLRISQNLLIQSSHLFLEPTTQGSLWFHAPM